MLKSLSGHVIARRYFLSLSQSATIFCTATKLAWHHPLPPLPRKSESANAFTEADAGPKRCESRRVCLDPYECKIVCKILRHDASGHFWGEPKRHLHRTTIFHDMGIGDDVTFG